MVRKTIRKWKWKLEMVVLNRSWAEVMPKEVIESRIWKLEDQRDQIKGEMNDIKSDFDDLVRSARNAGEEEVQELKTEASTLLSSYKANRTKWAKIHAGLNYLQQAALHKDIQQDSIAALPPETDPVAIQRTTEQWKDDFEEDRDRVSGFQRAADQMEGVHEGGSMMMDRMADGQAADIIDAAREGADVPTIDELADQAFESETEEDERSEPEAAPPTMDGFPGT